MVSSCDWLLAIGTGVGLVSVSVAVGEVVPVVVVAVAGAAAVVAVGILIITLPVAETLTFLNEAADSCFSHVFVIAPKISCADLLVLKAAAQCQACERLPKAV